jgi:hypothetical protein
MLALGPSVIRSWNDPSWPVAAYQLLLGVSMIILGIVLVIVGILIKIPILLTVGVVVLVIGAALFVLGAVGREVGGRRHYW